MATGRALVNVPLFFPDRSLPQDHHQSCFVSGLQVIVTKPSAQGTWPPLPGRWRCGQPFHLIAQDYSLIPLRPNLWALCIGIQWAAQYKAMLETLLGGWGTLVQPLLCVLRGRVGWSVEGRGGGNSLLWESVFSSVAFVAASRCRRGHFCTCWEVGVTQFTQMIQKSSSSARTFFKASC